MKIRIYFTRILPLIAFYFILFKTVFDVLLAGKMLLLEIPCDKFPSEVESEVNTGSWL